MNYFREKCMNTTSHLPAAPERTRITKGWQGGKAKDWNAVIAKSPARKAVKSIKQSSCAALVPILFRESFLRRRGSVAAQNSTLKHPAGNILTI